MKYSLFGDTGRFYKANLHGHTTVSDGDHTPEQIKQIYKDAGYQILAYTDHDVLVDQSALNDEDFLTITSCEYEFNDAEAEKEKPFSFVKTYHMLLFSPKPEVTCYPYANPDYVWAPNAKAYIQDFYRGSAVHDFNIARINEMIRDAHEKGFLVSYNHPSWSINTWPDYCGMQDVDFVECGNSGCFVEGYYADKSDRVYHDFLMLGKKCFPTATDDGHNSTNYLKSASFIKADSLTYGDVFDAMRKGRIYASWGPEFEDIMFEPETGLMEVKCSDVKYIYLITERRYGRQFADEESGILRGMRFDLSEYLSDTYLYGEPEKCFFRILLVDAEGKLAISPGFFVSDLKSEEK